LQRDLFTISSRISGAELSKRLPRRPRIRPVRDDDGNSLAQAILTEGHCKNITSGANPIEIKRGIEHCDCCGCGVYRLDSVPVRGERGFFSRDGIGQTMKRLESISDAMEKVGYGGLITF
jgi:hypothetical protein